MKIIFALIASFVFAVLLTTPLSGYAETSGKVPDTISGIIASRVIVVPDAKQEQVFEKVCKWVKNSAHSSCHDHASGDIFAKGEISYPSPSIDRIQYKFLYTMKIALKGNSSTVTFKEILLKSAQYYLSESNEEIGGEINQVILEKDKSAANKVLARLVDELQAYLTAGNEKNRIGNDCPNCAAMFSFQQERN
jgi:hypothetical protein